MKNEEQGTQVLDQVLARVVAPAATKVAKGASTTRRESSAPDKAKAGRDHVDAINQLFAEFELAYHNQFHKAYGQEGSLALAKKHWLGCLVDFTPEVIVRAARHLVKTQEFLPTLATVVAACENAPALFGLPTARAAYVEACCKPEPKAAQQWSHPAVYLAGRETGWYELASETQDAIFPLFEHNYQQFCQRVMRGEKLDLPVVQALTPGVATPLNPEENKARLAELRRKFDL